MKFILDMENAGILMSVTKISDLKEYVHLGALKSFLRKNLLIYVEIASEYNTFLLF